MIKKIGPFILNNDLDDLKLDIHNIFHVVASFFIALFTNFWISYGIGQAWEVGDGLKPWYTEYKYNDRQGKYLNWFRKNFLYSRKHSLCTSSNRKTIYWQLAI